MNDNIQYDTKQASQIMPVGPNPVELDFQKIIDQHIHHWSNIDSIYRQQYAKGAYMGTNSNLKDYNQILDLLIANVFQCLRDNANSEYDDTQMEEKQEHLLQVTAVEEVFKSGLKCLKSLKIKLDINLIASILQGSIDETTKRTTKEYEDRHGAKH
jgi:hypothetical protein